MNEVEIIVTADNRTFQVFEAVRKHIHGINDDAEKLSNTLTTKFAKKTGEKAGEEIKKGLSFSLSAFSDAPFELKAAGAAAGAVFGVAAASAVAAVLSGALLAGAATAGVVGGLKLAAKSPEVQDAASILGSTINAHLQAMATEVGFNSAAIDSLGKLGDAWGRNSVLIRDAFGAAVKYVDPLTDAVTGFAENVLPSITRAVQRAEPVVKVLSTGIPQLGKALGSALEDMTEHADEGAAALQMVLDITSVMVIGLGKAVKEGAEFYGTLLDIGSAASGFMEDIVGPLPIAGEYMRDVNDEFERLRDISNGAGPNMEMFSRGVKGTAGETRDMERAAKGAQRAVDELNQAFEDAFNTMMSVEESTINVKLGFIEMKEELKELGKFTDLNSEKGLRAKEVINDQISALERQREAAIEAGAGSKEATDAANKAYLAGIDTLRKMLKDLGLLTPAMEQYLAQWRELIAPKVVPVTLKVNVVESGGRIPGRGMYAQASGGLTPTSVFGAASGMLIGGGSLTKVGEYGEEYVRLPSGGQVYNNGQTQRMDAMMGAGMGAGGKLQIEVSAAPSFGQAYVDETIKQLRFRVRTEYGGDVDAFFDAYAGG